MSDFAPRKDSGRLMASQTKRNENSPDYWGEIAIDIKDKTKVQVVDGLYVFKLSGWKKKSKNGTTYLSLSVNRFIPPEESAPPARSKDDDSDVPF